MYSQNNSEVVRYDNFLGSSDNAASSSIIITQDKCELLCMILDLTPAWWLRYSESTVMHFIDTIVSFASIFLTFSNRKELAIIGVVPEKSEYIYTTDMQCDANINPPISSSKNRYLQFAESRIRENIFKLINESSSLVNHVNLSGGFIKSLCYFKRLLKLHRQRYNNQSHFSGRFIVVRSGLSDSSASFMSMMNGVFTAQKHGICIDVCVLQLEEAVNNAAAAAPATGNEFDRANILRQSVDMTCGIYLTIGKMRDLLQYFITLYLTDVDDRRFLTMINHNNNNNSVDIDFRASCFCHGTLVSVGYVCSLCLAVFCQYSSLCACCWAVFKDRKITMATESPAV